VQQRGGAEGGRDERHADGPPPLARQALGGAQAGKRRGRGDRGGQQDDRGAGDGPDAGGRGDERGLRTSAQATSGSVG
jgi:hypothetical protein